LRTALLRLFDPNVDGLTLVNNLYQEEVSRLNKAILEHDINILSEYVKRVKTGGSSQLA
jgi:hypothetical protein